METRVIKIDENTKLDRLDKVLAEKLDFSRKRIKDLLDNDHVLVNNKIMKASYKVCLLYTSPSPRDAHESRMPSSA